MATFPASSSPNAPAAFRRCDRPKKDPPPSPPAAQLHRGRSAGLNPAGPGPQGLRGGGKVMLRL